MNAIRNYQPRSLFNLFDETFRVFENNWNHNSWDDTPFLSQLRQQHVSPQQPCRQSHQHSSECHWALPIPLDYFRSDLLETDSGYELKIDLPDVKKDQINIELDSSRKILQVSLSQSEETENKNKNYLLNERSTSLFTRRYNLPCAVDGESVRAALQDGVLAISLNRIQAENDVIQVQIV